MGSGKYLGIVNMHDKNKASDIQPLEQMWKFSDGYVVSASRRNSEALDWLVMESGTLQRPDNLVEQLWNFEFDFTGVTMTNIGANKVFVGHEGFLKPKFEDPNGTLHQKWWMIPVKDFKGAMVMTINYDPG